MVPFLAFLAAASVVATDTAADFLQMGFTHILPYGLDHVLFILSLFFCCRDFAALLAQVTLFTVAHSLSLGVAALGHWEAPSRIIEVTIALSIALVAVQNIVRQKDGKGWTSYVLTFCFGLVHGLGFADAFRHAAGSASDFAMALVGFNVGVEAGQVVVVLAALSSWEDTGKKRGIAMRLPFRPRPRSRWWGSTGQVRDCWPETVKGRLSPLEASLAGGEASLTFPRFLNARTSPATPLSRL